MQKILGLDIGSYSVKAIEISNTFKTHEVTAFHEVVVPEIEGIDAAQAGIAAIRQIFADCQIEADRVYTSVMGLLVSTRILQLQNVKKRLIPAVVQGELEGQSPFPIENAVIDQQAIENHEGTTTVLAVIARKSDVEAYLNELKGLGIEPKIIDVDYLTYLNLVPFLAREGNPNGLAKGLIPPPNLFPDAAMKGKKSSSSKKRIQLILDIGHIKTSLTLIKGNRIVGVRTIRIAGHFFTEYLQKAVGCTYGEAQRLKHSVSRLEFNPNVQPPPGYEREFLVARQLTLAVGELMRELVRTLYSFKAQDKVFPEVIYLTGGSSLLQNLPEYISETLEIPVMPIEFDSTKITVEGSLSKSIPVMAQSLAIGLRGVHNKVQSQINLRRGELAFVGSYDAITRQATYVGLLVASLLAVLFLSYGLKWWLYGSQIDRIKKEYQIKVKQIIDGGEPTSLKNIAARTNWDLKAYSAGALKHINDTIKERDLILDGFSKKKSAVPLRLLEEVSKAIPKQLKVDVTEFSLKGNQVTIEVETDSIASSQSIVQKLSSIQMLQNVEARRVDDVPGSDGKIKKAWISATMKEGF